MKGAEPAEEFSLARLRHVSVGTTNEPKLEGVRAALAPFFPLARVQGRSVESGVAEQPVGFDAIVLGARNRASRAASMDSELSIGIEDGLVVLPSGPGRVQHMNVGCAAVLRRERYSLGFSSGFAYPPACVAPVLEGSEGIGPVFDRFWRQHRGDAVSTSVAGDEIPSGRTIGNIGKLSEGVLPRSEYARHAVVCALLPLLHPDLYPEPDSLSPTQDIVRAPEGVG